MWTSLHSVVVFSPAVPDEFSAFGATPVGTGSETVCAKADVIANAMAIDVDAKVILLR